MLLPWSPNGGSLIAERESHSSVCWSGWWLRNLIVHLETKVANVILQNQNLKFGAGHCVKCHKLADSVKCHKLAVDVALRLDTCIPCIDLSCVIKKSAKNYR